MLPSLALGYAGPEGRFMAHQALKMLRRGGVENMPPEILNQAASLHRSEVDKMMERA